NSSPLEDLDLSGDEVQRLTTAFQDPEFRRLLSEYAGELTDPENRKRYEAEITELERERGVEVRFVHPEPGHVLRTSLDGAKSCFVNVCSNVLVGAPSHHWFLPHSLAPGREYAGRRGTRYTVYDVVFHPDALALARRHERFRHMLDATALEAVEKQFGVKLDRRNAKTLKIKYKGTPEAAVLRTPLPGGAPARPEEEPEGPLSDFPYPYRYPGASGNSAVPQPQAPAPSEPRYSVVQRHHVDLQDYRCCRDSAPSPVPRELVVTIELPLLRSAEQAALEVTGKLLCLDSKKPDYQLRLSLPYPVDDSRGKAQFNKARRQLVITLPVALPATRRGLPAAPEGAVDPPGTDGGSCASARQGEAGPGGGHAEDRDSSTSGAGAADAGIATPSAPEVAYSPAGAGEEIIPEQKEQDSAMGGPGTQSGEPLCPPLQCNQDEESLILLIQVPRILPQSLRGDLNPLRYKLCFSTQDFVYYSFFLQFAPENKLSTKEPVISISSNNAVIELAKSPESHGHWRQWYYGLNNDSLEERLFVNEESVNEFLDEVLSSPFKQTIPLTPPLIEVLQITDSNIQIHAKEININLLFLLTQLQECNNSHQLHVKEEVNEGSHLTEKENTEHLITTTTEQEQTLGNARPDSSIADNAIATDSCGSVAYLQQESPDVFQVLSGKSQQPESKTDPEFIKEKCAVYSNEEKENLKEPVLTGNKTTVHNVSASESIKETNMQDGSVRIIKDHVTHCAFSFQNSLLYDLD
uniref:Protein kintoun n=1 Tax=Loxodonta africana TaxID=9785 RepID=G3SSC6_LOXAF